MQNLALFIFKLLYDHYNDSELKFLGSAGFVLIMLTYLSLAGLFCCAVHGEMHSELYTPHSIQPTTRHQRHCVHFTRRARSLSTQGN